MNLFIFNPTTYEVDINPEAVTLKPFNKIVKRDKTKLKVKAKAEFAYIYFMQDYKSDFQATIDPNIRSAEIIDVLEGLPEGWKPDKTINDALVFYKSRSETIASKALEKQRANIDKLIDKIGTFMGSDDANIVSKAAIMSKNVNQFIKDIDELEKVVKGQQETDSRHKGSQEKSMMEDD